MLVNNSNLTTIWVDENDQQIKIIDQRLLPHKLSIVTLNSVKEVEFAIREMQVRGAPLIGVTAAFGMYLAASINSFGIPIKNCLNKNIIIPFASIGIIKA